MSESDALLFLTEEELKQFTGYSKPKKQLEYLRLINMPHDVAAGTQPIVLRQAVVDRLSPRPGRGPGGPKPKPNFSSFKHK